MLKYIQKKYLGRGAASRARSGDHGKMSALVCAAAPAARAATWLKIRWDQRLRRGQGRREARPPAAAPSAPAAHTAQEAAQQQHAVHVHAVALHTADVHWGATATALSAARCGAARGGVGRDRSGMREKIHRKSGQRRR